MDWHNSGDATPTPADVHHVAVALESQHGAYAASVAEFLSIFHSNRGDVSRAWAWKGVAALVRQRAERRGDRDALSNTVNQRLH